VGVRTRLTAYGSWGYAHILRHVVPLLHERGLDESEVRQLLELNPRAVLALDAD
jgi:phosphotriesterase-related protein